MGKWGRRRYAIVGGVAVGVLVLGLGGVYVARKVNGAIGTATMCEKITNYLKTDGAIQTVGDGPLRVTVLGDSYSAGDALADRSDRWVTAFAEAADATVTLDAIGMTGYVNGGFCGGQEFGTRAATLSRDADLIIVQGGLNDWESPLEEVESNAHALWGAADDADLLVIGPARTTERPEIDPVQDTLRGAAEEDGIDYLSLTDLPLPLGPDGLHLTPEGHRQLADLVAAAVTSE